MSNAENSRKFALDLTRLFEQATNDAVTKATKKLALDALRGVVMKSPVGYPPSWSRPAPKGYVGGQFRGAWQLTVGSPGAGITGRKAPGKVGSANAAGRAASDAVHALTGLQPYQPVFIANGLPYAERLENGWSKQAPLGVVALTVNELNALVLRYVDGEIE